MQRNRSIPSKSATKGKVPKPGKAPVQRRVSVGKDARSGETLATEPRDVATSAYESTETTNSPTAAESATTPNVGEEESKAARSKKVGKALKAPKPSKAPKPAKERTPKRVSALDAAATILADTGRAMRASELIAEMQQRGLWVSPGGKTPESTLYAAISREIAFKGDASRFARGEKGFFIARKAG